MFSIGSLTCEYAENPLGIQVPSPRLSWKVTGALVAGRQVAYRVLVASSPDLLADGFADRWDSGKVFSSSMTLIEYQGRPLISRERCWWKVFSWWEGGEAAVSTTAWFEMGLLQQRDWHDAAWVGAIGNWTGRAILLRHEFELPALPVRGRAYIAGLGWYELRINGARQGDRVLEPPPTDYARRVLYGTYDIGAHLRAGKNTLDLAVGHGWYGTPKALMRLVVDLADGTVIERVSGREYSTFSVRPGAWMNDSVYEGEIFDARRVVPGWDGTPDGISVAPPPRHEVPMGGRRASSPGGELVANMTDPIRVVRRFAPRSISQPRPGMFVIDVGQNIAGWLCMRVTAHAGTVISLTFAELLYPDGTVNQENLLWVRGSDVYICRGSGEEVYEPRFTYHGFRYVQVEGYPGTPSVDFFEACQVRSDMPRRSAFKCDNDLLNRIQAMVIATEEANQHGVPTDCPQRAERMGWLNDMTARAEELIYNFHAGRFLTKWLADIADSQDPHGAIADTAPYNWGNQIADPVSVTPALVPWLMYRHYGDRRMLSECYPMAQRWHEYLWSRSDGFLIQYSNWGDWAPPIEFAVNRGAVSRDTPGVLMSSGCWLYLTRLLGRIACVLHRDADAQRYLETELLIGEAINRRFFDEAVGGYASNNQASNSFALWLGIVPPQHRERVVDNLVRDVERRDGHLTTGNLCTKFLLEALSDHGHADVAMHIATREDYPSWGYMLANGATTLWERWELMTDAGMCSHNHPMLGSVSSWFLKYLVGINDDESAVPGERFILRPRFVTGLNHVEGSLETLHGRLGVSWTREGRQIHVRVALPPGTDAIFDCTVPQSTCRIRSDEKLAWSVETGEERGGARSVVDTNDYNWALLASGEHAFTIEMMS